MTDLDVVPIDQTADFRIDGYVGASAELSRREPAENMIPLPRPANFKTYQGATAVIRKFVSTYFVYSGQILHTRMGNDESPGR